MLLLDVMITDGWLVIISIAIVVLVYNLYNINNSLSKERAISIQKDIGFKQKEAELKVEFQRWAFAEFEKFKNSEISGIKRDSDEQALNKARVLLQEWKIECEAKIRQDAINRSYSVNLGKITEHLAPFHASFLAQFNPKDARFIGSPIDLIVFDGYSDKRDDIITYFVEIKSGNSKLTDVQKKIKASILRADVRWAEINPDQPTVNTLVEPLKKND